MFAVEHISIGGVLRKRCNDACERIVRSAVVDFVFVGGTVGPKRSGNSCAITREGSPAKQRYGVTCWVGAKCRGSILDDIIFVDSTSKSCVTRLKTLLEVYAPRIRMQSCAKVVEETGRQAASIAHSW